jgi:hypothetical protein
MLRDGKVVPIGGGLGVFNPSRNVFLARNNVTKMDIKKFFMHYFEVFSCKPPPPEFFFSKTLSEKKSWVRP